MDGAEAVLKISVRERENSRKSKARGYMSLGWVYQRASKKVSGSGSEGEQVVRENITVLSNCIQVDRYLELVHERTNGRSNFVKRCRKAYLVKGRLPHSPAVLGSSDV